MADGMWGAAAISVRYDQVLALHDVTVAAVPGRVTAVVGGDGAGKTSLLRCLVGAVTPSSGQVTGPGPARTGYLPAGSGVYPDLTVTENLAFRAAAYGMPWAAARMQAGELIERAGLTDARERLAGQLSGGMRQKLGVIAAMLHKPDLLVLDEPTTGVDPVSRSGLWFLIADAAASGTAVVLATTYLEDAQRAAAVLVLDGGRQLAIGTPDEIVTATPGSVLTANMRPAGLAGRLSWRRGTAWRIWSPPGAVEPAGELVKPDLQDAVTVAALARELELTGEGAAARGQTKAAPAMPPAASPTARPYSTPAEVPAAAAVGTATARAVTAIRHAPLAECDAVTCRFGQFTAVREVSLRVMPGEVVGLLGANGAGKTTLIRLLLGLVHPWAGVVALLGEAPSRRTRRRIGYVPQGLGLYEDLTAAENLEFTAAVFGSDPAALPPDFASRADVPVGRLPLGLQRRAAFAQALSHQPELLILDEPTSGVDPLGRARLWETITGAARAGAGVLVSTHYMEEAEECDRLVIMADGVVVADGTAEQIVGGDRVTVVEAASWPVTFRQLADAGLPVALAGRTLRVPGATPAQVSTALAGQSTGDFRVTEARATLAERFFELTLHSEHEQVDA